MKKKVNFSISLKLTLIVISVSAVTIASIGLINIYFYDLHYEDIFFENPFYETASSHIQALDAIIGNNTTLNNKNILKNRINDFLNSTPPEYRDNILKITINLADENEELNAFYSTKGKQFLLYYSLS